ncbi:MAG: ABC transporter ATP-binding protein [Promethearchaeia archaeon]
MGNQIIINAVNLTKRFGALLAVDNVSFKINKGEIVGLLGPNGAGKTTTIRLLTGVFKLEKNSKIEIFGENISKHPTKYKRYFGIVPEVSNAYSDYNVIQNIRFSGRIYGIPKNEIEKRSKRLLKQFNLENKKYSKTKTLSKGLKQRLNFCLALLHEPPILILDEPTSGLDPISAKILRETILSLKNEGKTILMATHNLKEAQTICDRVLILNKGKIIADENPDTLRKDFKELMLIMFKFRDRLSENQQKELIDILNVNYNQIGFYELSTNKPLEDIVILNEFVKKYNLDLLDFKVKETSLEEVFIELINKDSLKNRGKI